MRLQRPYALLYVCYMRHTSSDPTLAMNLNGVTEGEHYTWAGKVVAENCADPNQRHSCAHFRRTSIGTRTWLYRTAASQTRWPSPSSR